MDEKIIEKYINGIASKEEKKAVLEWASSSKENEDELLNRKVQFSFQAPSNATPQDSVLRMRNNIRTPNKLTFLIRAAAILAIPLFALSIYQYVHYSNEVNALRQGAGIEVADVIPLQKDAYLIYEVNPGVKGLVNLPDGSKVWLNSSSTLKCPDRFDSTARVVELSGEGYFSIVGNERWPLYVKTAKSVTVKVTGTEFNLSSYSNDSDFRLTLVSGKVLVINDKTQKQYAVHTSEEFILSDTPNVQPMKQKANIHNNTGWKKGLLIFDNTPIPVVIKKMERWYGVSISIEDDRILNQRFSGEFQSESLSQVLEFLKISSDIRYSIKLNKVTLSY
jgi:hypothetical protein